MARISGSIPAVPVGDRTWVTSTRQRPATRCASVKSTRATAGSASGTGVPTAEPSPQRAVVTVAAEVAEAACGPGSIARGSTASRTTAATARTGATVPSADESPLRRRERDELPQEDLADLVARQRVDGLE